MIAPNVTGIDLGLARYAMTIARIKFLLRLKECSEKVTNEIKHFWEQNVSKTFMSVGRLSYLEQLTYI